MFKKYLIFFLVCGLFAWGAATVRWPSADNFFLDWHQILMNGDPPENPFVLVDVTGLADVEEDSPYAFSENRLRNILDILVRSEPRSVGLLLSSGEVEKVDVTIPHLAAESDYRKVRFFTNGTIFKETSFNRFVSKIPEEQRLYLTLSHDSYFDKVSRRIVLYFGSDRSNPVYAGEEIREFAGKSLQPADFKGTFEYLDSIQVFMKIWPREKWNVQKVSSLNELEKVAAQFKGKALLVGTLWLYSFNSTPGINGRLKWFGSYDIEKEFTADYELVANYMTNWYSGEYIKSPTLLLQRLWIFIGLAAVLGAVFFLPIKQALPVSLLMIAGYLFVGAMVFRWGSIEMDSARVTLVGMVAQYLILPVRYHRTITRQTKEKYESEARAVDERMKSKAMILAAASEAHMRVSAKISHDIRSPLMALRIVGKYLSEDVSKEVRGLFEDATNRIEFIAEDTLMRFRKGDGVGDLQDASVNDVVSSLVASFVKVCPSLKVENSVGDLRVAIPFHSLQRTLSNLFQNSIDACAQAQTNPVLRLEAREEGDYIILLISDNGVGIADEIRSQLFKPRATFGKAGGTGLGLFQVREELESYGASIFCDNVSSGACFSIKIPTSLELLKISLVGTVYLIGGEDFLAANSERLVRLGIQLEKFNSFAEAGQFLGKNPGKISVISELLVEGDSDTAFDFLDAASNDRFDRVIVCSALVGNREVYDLAAKRGVLLVSRNQLQKVDFVRKNASL